MGHVFENNCASISVGTNPKKVEPELLELGKVELVRTRTLPFYQKSNSFELELRKSRTEPERVRVRSNTKVRECPVHALHAVHRCEEIHNSRIAAIKVTVRVIYQSN